MLTPFRHLGKTLGGWPREARDTLFMLGVIAWIVLLQTGHVPAWTSVITLSFLAWRGWISWRGRALPTWPYRLSALGLTLVATAMTHHTLLGKEAGVTLVTCLLALKTLEMRARRDAFVIFFLGFFTLLTHLFYSQSILSAVGIVIGLLGLLTGLVNAHMPVGYPPLRRSAGIASRLALAGAPVMIVLFALFPRVAPLWALPLDEDSGQSGLSDSMNIGQIAELALNDDIAFRIRFQGARPTESQMYFRGPVMARFDGKTWQPAFTASLRIEGKRADLSVGPDSFDYVVLMEASTHPWLFTLDMTPEQPRGTELNVWQANTGQWMLTRSSGQVIQYSARSFTEYRLDSQLDSNSRRVNLFIPVGSNPRTVEWAKELRARLGEGSAADQKLVDQALERLRTGGYVYTLAPGIYGQETADEFWFDRKAGFCEHIASSFVLLMRAAGIPARVVAGYQGGAPNPVDGSWIVRQSDAHAWAEIWLPDRGWTRIDPTGYVAPSRLEGLSTLRPRASGIERAVQAVSPTFMSRWRNLRDAADAAWKRWVVDYNQNKQLDLLKSLGFETPDWSDLGYVLAGLLAASSLAAGIWTAWERRQHDPWLRLLDQVRARMRKSGWSIPDGIDTPRGLVRQMEMQTPHITGHPQITDWLMRMERLRYARQSSDTLVKLKAEFFRLPWPKSPT